MQPPLSDQERPSLYTLSKVKHNLAKGEPHVLFPWESYSDADFEGRLTRAGKMPKDIRKGCRDWVHILTVKHDEKAIETGAGLSGLRGLGGFGLRAPREVSDIRAPAFHMLGVVDFSRLREVPPERMRRPTVNEARKTDRLIFQEVLSGPAKEKVQLRTASTTTWTTWSTTYGRTWCRSLAVFLIRLLIALPAETRRKRRRRLQVQRRVSTKTRSETAAVIVPHLRVRNFV